MAQSDPSGNEPFFIVGTGRSGTTLLQAMLACHPRLAIPPETKFFQKHDPGTLIGGQQFDQWIERYFSSQDWRDLGLDRAEVEQAMRKSDRSAGQLFSTILDAWRALSDKPRIGEKSPLHCWHVRRILEVIPKAQFIHIYRDPRDVVASMQTMQWMQGTIRDTARYWRKILDEHFRLSCELPPHCYNALKYESLVENPERELKRICEFLNESFDPAMLDFHERTASGFHERERSWKGMTQRPVTTQSIGRFRDQLTPRQIALIERICMPVMRKLGYEPISGWRTYQPLWIAIDTVLHVMRKTRKNLQ